MRPYHLLTALAALSLSASPIRAQAPTPAADLFVKEPGADPQGPPDIPTVVNTLELYALSPEDALTILRSEAGDDARYQKVLDLEKAGKSRLKTLTSVTNQIGERSVVTAVDEVRYPTEFEPGQPRGTPPSFTAFDTRNTGDTLEFILQFEEAQSVILEAIPGRTILSEFRALSVQPGDPAVTQPIFATQKIQTKKKLHIGHRGYLGTFSPARPQGVSNGKDQEEVWLGFFKADLMPISSVEVKSKGAKQAPVDLEYTVYSMERALARELLSAIPKLEAPWEVLQRLLSEKKARFEHVVSLSTRLEERAITEEIQEVRFITEVDAPYIGKGSYQESIHKTTKNVLSEKNEISEETRFERLDGQTSSATPTAFETRNAGMTIEVFPSMIGDRLSIEHIVTSTGYLGYLQIPGEKPAHQQPLFESRKFSARLFTTLGANAFIGTLNPPGSNGVNSRQDDGRTYLVFLRVSPNQP